MKRTFKLQIIYPSGCKGIPLQRKATDHRNAAMLVVQKYNLIEGFEITVQEIIELPKSTYRVFKHESYQIEQKC